MGQVMSQLKGVSATGNPGNMTGEPTPEQYPAASATAVAAVLTSNMSAVYDAKVLVKRQLESVVVALAQTQMDNGESWGVQASVIKQQHGEIDRM